MTLDGGSGSEKTAQQAIIVAYDTTTASTAWNRKVIIGNNCTIANNNNTFDASGAAYQGGGILYYYKGSVSDLDEGLVIDGGTIQNCSAQTGGGVYYLCNASGKANFVFKAGSISNNEATGTTGGGGVYVGAGKVILKGTSAITGNKACQNLPSFNSGAGGGGMFLKAGSSLEITGGSITGNTCRAADGSDNGGSGGGIFMGGDNSISIKGYGVTINDNSSGRSDSDECPNIRGKATMTVNGSEQTFVFNFKDAVYKTGINNGTVINP